jgi:hypothetical protein
MDSKIVPLRKDAPLHPSSSKGPKTPTAASGPGSPPDTERKKTTCSKTQEGAPVLQLLQTQRTKLNVSPCYFGEEKTEGLSCFETCFSDYYFKTICSNLTVHLQVYRPKITYKNNCY